MRFFPSRHFFVAPSCRAHLECGYPFSGKKPCLEIVFRAGLKRLDEIRWNFQGELWSRFGTKFTRCALRGGSARGKIRRFGLHEGVFEGVFKTDPCAREFRQRSFTSPNMDMCTLNARPLQEIKVAILDPLRDTFRGVPRREFLSGGRFLAHA